MSERCMPACRTHSFRMGLKGFRSTVFCVSCGTVAHRGRHVASLGDVGFPLVLQGEMGNHQKSILVVITSCRLMGIRIACHWKPKGFQWFPRVLSMDPVVSIGRSELFWPWPLPEKVVLPRVYHGFWVTIRIHFFWQAAPCAKCGFPPGLMVFT